MATLSLGGNFPGRSFESLLFAAYGVAPHPARNAYYRRSWRAEDAASR